MLGAADQGFLARPFDALRHRYARAVTTGLSRRSIVASGELERVLDRLEQITLWPLARRR
ncbi:hypothetical protein [uncultured Piscinibacter sp.]|uniref:hypothetical protein n=1 Tax=uncultured Piscinibacter sp. TaxID=1131835 RepID=UPI002610CFE4|nr:hypothetical protein [uncultured Piscinibacter sp.]